MERGAQRLRANANASRETLRAAARRVGRAPMSSATMTPTALARHWTILTGRREHEDDHRRRLQTARELAERPSRAGAALGAATCAVIRAHATRPDRRGRSAGTASRVRERVEPASSIVSTTPKEPSIEYGRLPALRGGRAAWSGGSWRRCGYWQGSTADLRDSRSRSRTSTRLPSSKGGRVRSTSRPRRPASSRRRARTTMRTRLPMARYSGCEVDPAVGIDIGSGERRRLLVERESAKVGA